MSPSGIADEGALASSAAYCGLVCGLCFLAAKCDGCRSAKSRCDRDLSDQGCPNKG
jgi:hypothetical protein